MSQNTFLKAAQPIRNPGRDPNSPEHRLYTGTSGTGESVLLYKASDSRPGRDNGSACGRNTVTLLYQLIIDTTAERRPLAHDRLVLLGLGKDHPHYCCWINPPRGESSYLSYQPAPLEKSRHTFQILPWIISAIRNIKAKTGASRYFKQTPLALLARFMPG